MRIRFLVFIATAFVFNSSFAQGNFTNPDNLFVFKGKNDKFGFVDANGKLMVLPKYDEASDASEGVSVVKINNLYGYINETGKEIISAQYEDADNFSEGLAAVKKGGKYGFINKLGKEVIPFIYENAYAFSEGFAAVKYKGKFGFIDTKGKKLTSFEFDEVQSFSEGLAKVFKGETIYDKQGFINREGKLVIPYIYDHNLNTYGAWNQVRNFVDGLMLVSKNGNKGYMDNRGDEVVPTIYSTISPMHKGYAAYYSQADRKWGIVNKKGRELTAAIFDGVKFDLVDDGYDLVITSKKDDKAANYSGEKYGLFSITSQHNITLPYYDEVGEISNGMMVVKLNKKYGAIDSTGKLVVPLAYDYIGAFNNGTAPASLNKRYGIISAAGKELVPLKYDDVENFYEGLALVVLNKKVGFADKAGKETIALQFDDAVSFNEGVSVVKKDKIGLIDKTGRLITAIKYDEASKMSNGVSVVVLNGKYGLVNKTGNEIVSPAYQFMVAGGDYLFFESNGKWGVMTNTGSIVIDAQFDGFVQEFIKGVAVAIKNGRAVYIDKTGKIIGEPGQ